MIEKQSNIGYNYIKGKNMDLRVIVEYDAETNSYSAVCPELPGCTSCGDTKQEAMENVKEAIELYLEPDSKEISPSATVYEVSV